MLSCDLRAGRGDTVRVERRFGFRQVEVRGSELYVNGMPVKLHGVCRHEVHPLRGRSLTPELWRRDAEIFREGNVNLIRTSHYPPAEEFLDACDELGLFVEEEAPICWVGHGTNPKTRGWFGKSPGAPEVASIIVRMTLEMMERDRSHPSVIIWSLANECGWSRFFRTSHEAARALDSSRPISFHDQCWGGYNNRGSGAVDVANFHYCGPGGPARTAGIARPVVFGEYCHLNAYNRHALVTDPGLRDFWGKGFASMWESMYATAGCLGGSLWSAIDDSFFLPSGETVGYGTWGPIDG